MAFPTTEVAAWGGLLLGIFNSLLEVVKARRSRLRVTLDVGMDHFLVSSVGPSRGPFISARARNEGGVPITIESMVFRYYETWFRRLIRKPTQLAVVGDQRGLGTGLPYVLEPGRVWDGIAIQSSDVEAWVASGIVYCGIKMSASPYYRFRRLRSRRVPSRN